jgi:hypothetical protein
MQLAGATAGVELSVSLGDGSGRSTDEEGRISLPVEMNSGPTSGSQEQHDSPGEPGAGDLPEETRGRRPAVRLVLTLFICLFRVLFHELQMFVGREAVRSQISGSTANEAHSIARARRVAQRSLRGTLVFLSVYFWGVSIVRETSWN